MRRTCPKCHMRKKKRLYRAHVKICGGRSRRK